MDHDALVDALAARYEQVVVICNGAAGARIVDFRGGFAEATGLIVVTAEEFKAKAFADRLGLMRSGSNPIPDDEG